MSDTPTGPSSFQAADGKWYNPVLPPPPAAQIGELSGLAIASMVLGIIWIYWIGSILAVIFGHIALSQFKKDPLTRGKGFAIAGVVLGWVGIGIFAIALAFGVAIGLNEGF